MNVGNCPTEEDGQPLFVNAITCRTIDNDVVLIDRCEENPRTQIILVVRVLVLVSVTATYFPSKEQASNAIG
jgi:hypothetical protein